MKKKIRDLERGLITLFKVNFGGITKSLKSLIKKLLTKSPEERLEQIGESLAKVKTNSFYNNIWEKLEGRTAKPPFLPNLKGITGTKLPLL